MPGTGKTTTTAEIIKSLVKHNKSVLVTSYTNAALDNILGKLVDQGVDVLRLGNPDKVKKITSLFIYIFVYSILICKQFFLGVATCSTLYA